MSISEEKVPSCLRSEANLSCEYKQMNMCIVVLVYPLLLLHTYSLSKEPLLVGGGSDLPACGPPASFSAHLASSAVTPAGSVRKSMVVNVVRMWVQLKRWCV